MTEDGRTAWRNTFHPQSNEEARVLAALTPEERVQFDGFLRRMMGIIDRPGLLDLPTEVRTESGQPRSRFTAPDEG